MILLHRADLPISPWRNGAGRKADIITGPGWHIGFAFLDADAPFSNYTGHDRTITLVQGPGFTLSNPTTTLTLTTPGHPTQFDGAWPLHCHIHDTPCIVVNAMTDRATHHHTVSRFPGGPIDPTGTTADTLVVLAGQVHLGEITATTHDAVILTTPTHATLSPNALVMRLTIKSQA